MAYEAGEMAVSKLSAHHTEEDVRREFASMLTSVLGTLAQQLRYEDAAGNITQNGEFTSRVQIELCDAFLILPSVSTEFRALLKREIVEAIRGGWDFQGAWGHLELTRAGDLVFQLEPPEFLKNPGFVRARRVKVEWRGSFQLYSCFRYSSVHTAPSS
jgi:hypothetical protein